VTLALVGGIAGCAGDDEGDDTAATEPPPVTAPPPPPDETPVRSRELVTRPDLTPPVIEVTTDRSMTPGYLFLAPKQARAQTGPLIVDHAGEVVWSNPRPVTVTDFRVQTYRGEPVLTWWEGDALGGYGNGDFVIVDNAYREVARVQAGDGLEGDQHEFQLTEDGTALILAYPREPADLSDVGGPAEGYVLDNRVQEVDVETGELLFDWSALDHSPLTDTYEELVADAAATADRLDDDGSAEAPFDWFHANSVSEGPDGTLLVSARNTHAVYALDRESGEVRWQMGGRDPDVVVEDARPFAWQHDARLLDDGTISLFDNEADPPVGDASRALVLDVDVAAGTAAVVRDVTHPEGVLSGSQGNVQVMPGGGLLVGWGSRGRVTEFSADGQIVYDATWAPADSYRVFRSEWTGRPPTLPDVATRAADGGRVEVAASWNGATEVASWRFLAGDGPEELEAVTTAARDGFETAAVVDVPPGGSVAAEALDADGAVLARSEPVDAG